MGRFLISPWQPEVRHVVSLYFSSGSFGSGLGFGVGVSLTDFLMDFGDEGLFSLAKF